MNPVPAPIPYELRIGVSGHRELAKPRDARGIEDEVRRVLEHLQETLESASTWPRGNTGSPHSPIQRFESFLAQCLAWIAFLLRMIPTARRIIPSIPVTTAETDTRYRTPLQWSVVSPLAAGVDQIVAHAVLAMTRSEHVLHHLEPKLQAVLPFQPEEYENDFDEGQTSDFRQLLEKDPQFTVVPAPVNVGPDEPRHAAYLRAGHYTVHASEILLAIWDGKEAEGLGGTADVVAYAVGKGRLVLWIDAEKPKESACILTNEETDHPGPQPGMWVTELPTTAKGLSPNFHRQAAFNRDPAFHHADFDVMLRERQERIRQNGAEAGVPIEITETLVCDLLPLYARASQMADTYQRLFRIAARGLPILSVMGVTLVVFQVLFFPNRYNIIWFEFAILLAAWALLRVSRNEAWQEKWLHDRHLAERLRAASHTLLLGHDDTHSHIDPQSALPFYRGPDVWFIEPFELLTRSVRNKLGDLAVHKKLLEPIKRFVIVDWIGSQAVWHAQTTKDKEFRAKRGQLIGLGTVLAILSLSVVHALGFGHGDHGARLRRGDLWIAFAAITIPALGAALHAMESVMDYERLAERSKRMSRKLGEIAKHATLAEDFGELRKAVNDAEEIIAMENHEWLVSLRFRVPEF